MNKRLTELIQQLKKHNITHRVIDLGEPTVRTRDLVERDELDVNTDQIVKTILFKSKKRGVFAVAVQGKDRVSYTKIKTLLEDKKISTLRPEEMKELGWTPGECCPLNVPGPLYVDNAVFTHPKINTGSGDLHYGLEFTPDAIQKLRDDVTVLDVHEA